MISGPASSAWSITPSDSSTRRASPSVHKSQRVQPGHTGDVLIPHHHDGYIPLETFERIQRIIIDTSALVALKRAPDGWGPC